MSTLPKRFAAIVVCVAVIGIAETTELRIDLGGRAAKVLTQNHARSTPAELGACRTSARLFASAREQRLDGVHPAIAGSYAVGVGATRGISVGWDAIVVFASTPLRLHGDRGPPSHLLS